TDSDAVAGQQLHQEFAVLGGHLGGELLGGNVLGDATGVLRYQDVHAVGPAIGVCLDPVELDLQLLGGEAAAAQNAETAVAADRRNHVATMAEGEQRKLTADHFTEFVLHDAQYLRVVR